MSTQFGRPRAPAAQNGKKLVIKPLKSKPKLPENFADLTWKKLRAAVLAVLAKQPVSTSLEELYRAVEDMCLHKLAQQLYTYLQTDCDQHIQRQLETLSHKQSLDLLLFLQQVERCWADLCEQMLTIRSIFLYLDRTYVLTTTGTRSLFEMGVHLFRTHLDEFPDVKRKTVQGLLAQIEAERRGETVDRVLLKHILSMFSSIGIYTQAFQLPFLEQTSTFYGVEAEQYLQQTDIPEYLQYCERRLHEEYDRCDRYLDSSTRKPLIHTVEQQLLEAHIARILSRGFQMLMDENRITDLARLYSLAQRVQALEVVKIDFRNYIKQTGSSIVLDEEKDKDMITLLLDFKDKLDIIVQDAFSSNETFSTALKDAFEQFVNQRQNKPAELLAKFIDSVMKTGTKGQSEEELEALLDKALVIFRYIQGKDVFEAFYKKDLAKRLLLSKSASIDAEKSMISKLKAECGSQFTNKLEGMFKDVDLSRDILTSFKQSTAFRSRFPPGIDMGVSVLTSGYWPTYPSIDTKLPEELNQCQQIFKDFYLSKHSGRRLVWYNSLGTCIIKANFPACGVRELQVSLLQATVVMLFNSSDSLSYSEIQEATGIEPGELKRTLQSLACGKIRILTKTPMGRDVDEDDGFSFNEKFNMGLFRIKINSIQMKETVEENKKTNEQVLQDRQYQVDAAIVRIMKTRKTLSHKLLVNELLTQLKFPIRQADLKKRVESLIDREYLERDANNPNVYNYLA